MNHNDTLRELSTALKLSDDAVVQVFAKADEPVPEETVRKLLSGDEDCGNAQLAGFLDALILKYRGPRPDGKKHAPHEGHVSNNHVLKKLRIALELREEQLLALFKAAGHPLSKHDLTPLFRAKGHKHHKKADDELMRAFFAGIALRSNG